MNTGPAMAGTPKFKISHQR